MKKCPICDTAWVYASVGDYGSGYDNKGYKINCRCGYAWKHTDWKKTMEEAFKKLEFSLRNKESNMKVAYIGRGRTPKTLAQMLFDKCDYLQTHKYEECEQCYRYDICRNTVNKEKKER